VSDDLKIYRAMKALEHCGCVQMDISAAQKSCFENYIDINIQKTNAISFPRKAKNIRLYYHIGDFSILRTDRIKDLVLCCGKLLFVSPC
jgi:hypothetical protein